MLAQKLTTIHALPSKNYNPRNGLISEFLRENSFTASFKSFIVSMFNFSKMKTTAGYFEDFPEIILSPNLAAKIYVPIETSIKIPILRFSASN